MTISLSDQDQQDLLDLARRSIGSYLEDRDLPEIQLSGLSPALREERACFVTLTRVNQLRGCVGSLHARQPLACEVQDRAVSAAFHDFRFPRLQAEEFPEVRIEISCLTVPEKVEYSDPAELIHRLRPDQDGVIISDGRRKATFLPQVWDQLPAPEAFLSRLCEKMGADRNCWKQQPLEVQTYQVTKFKESPRRAGE